jgi:beta-lactamase class A
MRALGKTRQGYLVFQSARGVSLYSRPSTGGAPVPQNPATTLSLAARFRYDPGMIAARTRVWILTLLAGLLGPAMTMRAVPPATQPYRDYVLSYDTSVDPHLQAQLTEIDARLRDKLGIKEDETNVGLLDLEHLRLAMIHPDHTEYAASVAKIGILLAYFQTHPEAATNLDPTARHELGLMIKVSSNEMASKYSHIVGLKKIQSILDSYGFYDKSHGGGIWCGKHYSRDGERYPDPVSDNSHAANVRQLLRYYLLLEQGKLVSPEASATMRQIFDSPDIPADENKFVKGLAGRGLHIIVMYGNWQDWIHDTADITCPGRHYFLVELT